MKKKSATKSTSPGTHTEAHLGIGHYVAGGEGGGLLILGGGSLFFELKFGEGHFFSIWI